MTSFLIDPSLETEKKDNFYKLLIRLIFLRQSVFNGVINKHMKSTNEYNSYTKILRSFLM